uniref:Uncharacterized protein n=1 Tax=Ananas comosus var. bracteatus TaxID=296719 RepID=A0A6V7PYD9_ANACO|nr:unnamed protein product [Ananas comosus var. bracteatus]
MAHASGKFSTFLPTFEELAGPCAFSLALAPCSTKCRGDRRALCEMTHVSGFWITTKFSTLCAKLWSSNAIVHERSQSSLGDSPIVFNFGCLPERSQGSLGFWITAKFSTLCAKLWCSNAIVHGKLSALAHVNVKSTTQLCA